MTPWNRLLSKPAERFMYHLLQPTLSPGGISSCQQTCGAATHIPVKAVRSLKIPSGSVVRALSYRYLLVCRRNQWSSDDEFSYEPRLAAVHATISKAARERELNTMLRCTHNAECTSKATECWPLHGHLRVRFSFKSTNPIHVHKPEASELPC